MQNFLFLLIAENKTIHNFIEQILLLYKKNDNIEYNTKKNQLL
jgi:hypothetical protein